MIKALFFDIDGTLVSFRTHDIPTSTIEALRTAKAKGIKIFISTGRPPVIINNLQALQERNLIDGYITMNGAYCFVGNEVIYKSPIDPSEAKALIDFCVGNRKACIVVGEKDIHVCQENDEVRRIFYEALKVDKIPPIEAEAALRKEIFQLTPFITEAEENEVKPDIPRCEIGRWYPSFADITAKGNTKQRGIDAIIGHFGLKLDETMAFGDGGNDIPMLRHAGIGVAMGNASDEVKSHADFITTSVDDAGIAHALKHFGIVE